MTIKKGPATGPGKETEMQTAIDSIAHRTTPIAPQPSWGQVKSLTRWAARIRASVPRRRPPRRERRAWLAWERALEKAQARIRRRLARRFGPLGPHNADAFLVALDQAKTAHVLSNNAAVARLHGRRGLLARKAPRPRAPAVVVPRTAPAAPGEGPSAQGPPGQGEDASSESDGEPPSPSPRPRRARGRGRPRGARRFRAFPGSRTYRKRLQELDSIAAALEGDPGALFLTLLPPEPPGDQDRRLAAIPPAVARAFAALAARLRRDGATFAMVVATRADSGAFFPHAHVILGGVSLARLRVLAARSGLLVGYAEALRDPKGAARYIASSVQKRHWDRILGARGFYAGVSPRNASHPEPALPAPEAIPPGLELVPGVRIADVPTFLAALAQDLESRLPAVRGAARHRLALLLAALAERGPP